MPTESASYLNLQVHEMPPMHADIVNATLTIISSMELIMAEAVEAQQGLKRMNMASISNQFFRRCGIPAGDWTFCDSLFLRYFAKFSKIVHVGKVFSSHATCFLLCILLMDQQELVKLVTDVYSDGPALLISYDCFGKLLFNILDTKTGGNCEQHVSELILNFRNYAGSNPLYILDNNEYDYYSPKQIFPIINDSANNNSQHNTNNNHHDSQAQNNYNRITGRKLLRHDDALRYVGPFAVSTQVVTSYCGKKYPTSLWPLAMLQAQLRKIFLGEEFWMRYQKEAFFAYLRDKGVTKDVFVCAQIIFKVYIETSAQLALKAQQESQDNNNSNNNSNSSDASPSPGNPGLGGLGGKAGLGSTQSTQAPGDLGFAVASNLRVLIIEDSKSQRKIMMKRLQLASGQLQKNNKLEDSWVVGAASSGEEALHILETQEEKVDVVIVDENLGGSGGVLLGHEVVKIMRESLHMTDTVIIGCTANTKRNTQTLLEAGADSVWPKPMPDDASILSQVAHFLSRRHLARSAPEDTFYPNEANMTKPGTGNPKERIRANQGGRIRQILLGR